MPFSHSRTSHTTLYCIHTKGRWKDTSSLAEMGTPHCRNTLFLLATKPHLGVIATNSLARAHTHTHTLYMLLYTVSFPGKSLLLLCNDSISLSLLPFSLVLCLGHLWPSHQCISMATIICTFAEGFISLWVFICCAMQANLQL